MSRRLRDKSEGVFHVYAHSVWAAELYRDDRDRLSFIRELAQAGEIAGWICLGFCVMTNHYHVMVDVPDDALPIGMHALNFRHAVKFNVRHRMKGHVLGARYDSVRIQDDAHLLEAYRYMVMNPVEAGLCATPEEWPWSNYAGTIGMAEPHSFDDPSRIIGCFDGPRELQIAQLRAFVKGR